MINFSNTEQKAINSLFTIYKINKQSTQDIGHEFEITFTENKEFNNVKQLSFMNLLKYLKKDSQKTVDNKWTNIENTTSLDIKYYDYDDIDSNLYSSSDSRLKNYRLTIKGSDNISIFCKNNNLDNINIDNIIQINKPRVAEISEDKLSELEENVKDLKKFNNGQFISSVKVKNYNIKFKYQKEIPIDDQLYKDLDIESKFKTFRLKNRFSFESKCKTYRLDLTIVQDSQKNIDNKGLFRQVPVKFFHNAKLLDQEKTYEVELEIINPDNFSETTNFVKEISEKIEEIFIIMNKYPFITSKKENDDIIDIYKKLIIFNKLNIIEKKKNLLKLSNKLDEKIIPDQYKDFYNLILNSNEEKKSEISEKLIFEENKLHKAIYYSNSYVFNIGPKQVTLPLESIQKVKDYDKIKTLNLDNSLLYNDYTVTDKADGMGKLLYIVGTSHLENINTISSAKKKLFTDPEIISEYKKKYSGNIYLIDNNLIVYSTNLTIRDYKKNNYMNTLLNGEYIEDLDTVNNKLLQRFLAYDIYFYKYNPNDLNSDTKYLPLMLDPAENNDGKRSRDSDINTIIQNFEKDVENILPSKDDKSQFILQKKNFLYCKAINTTQSGPADIFQNSYKIWTEYLNHKSKYKYDGLIFTPAKMPVGYKKNAEINYDLNTGTTWSLNFKWKPPYENTIDFLIKSRSKDIRQTNINYEGTTNNYSYKSFDLFVSKKDNYRFKPIQFFPYNPAPFYSSEPMYANIILDKNNNIRGNHWDLKYQYSYDTEEGSKYITGKWKVTDEIISDNTIVEFSYRKYPSVIANDKDYEYRNIDDSYESFRWIPLRTRHEKTYLYKNNFYNKNKKFHILKKLITLDLKIERNIEIFYNLYSNIQHTVQSIKNNNKTKWNEAAGQQKHIEFSMNKEIINQSITSIYDIYEDSEPAFGNNHTVADNNWAAINSPITERMITTGLDIPFFDDIYYYSKNKFKGPIKNALTFHNQIIKKYLLINSAVRILRSIDSSVKIKLLDLATGKGGDINKWFENHINFVIGIDNIQNNIYDRNDGALERFSKKKREFHSEISSDNSYSQKIKPPEIKFLLGDVGKNMMNGEAFDPKNFEMNDTNQSKNKAIQQQYFNTEKRFKFNIISIMFAIHYFYKNQTILDQLIDNIDNYLEEGGFLIGCSPDGNKILKKIEEQTDTPDNEYSATNEEKKKIWSYTTSELYKKEDIGIGNKVNVFITSIGGDETGIPEYLFYIDILIEKLKKKNICLLNKSEINFYGSNTELLSKLSGTDNLSYGNFEDIFNKINNNEIESLQNQDISATIKDMNENEKNFSFLNQYFIFKKKKTQDDIYVKIMDWIIENINKFKLELEILELIKKSENDSTYDIDIQNIINILQKNYSPNEYLDIDNKLLVKTIIDQKQAFELPTQISDKTVPAIEAAPMTVMVKPSGTKIKKKIPIIVRLDVDVEEQKKYINKQIRNIILIKNIKLVNDLIIKLKKTDNFAIQMLAMKNVPPPFNNLVNSTDTNKFIDVENLTKRLMSILNKIYLIKLQILHFADYYKNYAAESKPITLSSDQKNEMETYLCRAKLVLDPNELIESNHHEIFENLKDDDLIYEKLHDKTYQNVKVETTLEEIRKKYGAHDISKLIDILCKISDIRCK